MLPHTPTPPSATRPSATPPGATPGACPIVSWESLTGYENLLILAPRPGDESLYCGGLIARCCRRGRPPFVVILTDGTASPPPSFAGSAEQLAVRHERETRAAAQQLGLPAHRLLLAGLFEGTVPAEGPTFDAVVGGITLVMWARDCNVICVPWADDASADHAAAYRIAVSVANTSGVGLLACVINAADAPLGACRLDITREIAEKRAAMAAHAARNAAAELPPHEVFVRPARPDHASR